MNTKETSDYMNNTCITLFQGYSSVSFFKQLSWTLSNPLKISLHCSFTLSKIPAPDYGSFLTLRLFPLKNISQTNLKKNHPSRNPGTSSTLCRSLFSPLYRQKKNQTKALPTLLTPDFSATFQLLGPSLPQKKAPLSPAAPHSLATACSFSLESHCHVSTSRWSSKPLTWFLTNQPCMDTWLLEIVTLGKIGLHKNEPQMGVYKYAPLR